MLSEQGIELPKLLQWRCIGMFNLAFIACVMLVRTNVLASSPPLSSTSASPSAQTFTFFVASDGNDVNPGSSNAPFATLSKARDIVRGLAHSMTTNVLVLIRPGEYFVTNTIVFTEQDSGHNGYDIIYRADGAVDSVRFIGGERITAWQPCTNGIFMANVPGPAFHTLYENDKRAWKARTPNRNVMAAYPMAQGDYLRAAGVNGSRTNLTYAPGDLDPRDWGLSGAQVYLWSGGNWMWFTDTVPITGLDLTNRSFTLAQPARYPVYQNGKGSRYYIQGVLSLLDQPGEFHYDPVAGRLYYRPMNGHPAAQEIIVPRVKRLLALEGVSESNRVSHIRFEGLRFEGTEFTDWFRHASIAAGDTGEKHTYPVYDRDMTLPQHRMGIVYCENTDQIVFDGCHLLNSGYNGMYWFSFNQSNTVQRCKIDHCGYSGIYFEGRYPGEGDVLKQNRIVNNLIHDVGEQTGGVACVQFANAGSNEVAYCDLYNSVRYGMTFNTYVGITNSDNYTRGNWMHHLRIHDCCQDSGDTASVYSFGSSMATIPYNQNTLEQLIVDDSFAHPSMDNLAPFGVYMDGDSAGQIIKNVDVGNSQNVPYHNNATIDQFLTNVSWNPGFDPDQMDYASIGVQADFPYPVMPTRVLGWAGGNNISYLSWLPVANAVEYRVYMATNGAGPFALIGNIAAPGFVNAISTRGRNNYYRVSSVTAAGLESPLSKSAVISPGANMDDFENGLSRWTAGAGTLHLSTNQSHSGAYSFVVDQDVDVAYMDLGIPNRGAVQMWLFDPGNTARREVFARVDNSWNSSNGWAGLGISTSVSMTNYCYRIDDGCHASTVSRTPGWHRLNWDYTSGTNATLAIDGTVVANVNHISDFRTIAFGDWWVEWTDEGIAGVYFDDVLINSVAKSIDSDHDGMDDTWERLNFNGSLAVAGVGTDFDGDGFSDYEEYLAGTNPRDRESRLRFVPEVVSSTNQLQLTFLTVPGRTYDVEVTSTLSPGIWTPLQTNIVANSAMTKIHLSKEPPKSSSYFRVHLHSNPTPP